MQIKAPRLYRNRCGVYYFRVKSGGKEKRISLRTKCSKTANILALQLNLDLERRRDMGGPKLSDFNFDVEALRRYEISLKNGATVRTDGSAEEHARAMEMMAQIERIGMIDPEDRPLRRPAKSEPMTLAVDKWLANCGGKNGERTVDTKVYHIKDFLERSFPLVESVERWLALHEKVEFNKNKGLRRLEENKAAGRHPSQVGFAIAGNLLARKVAYKAWIANANEKSGTSLLSPKWSTLSKKYNIIRTSSGGSVTGVTAKAIFTILDILFLRDI